MAREGCLVLRAADEAVAFAPLVVSGQRGTVSPTGWREVGGSGWDRELLKTRAQKM